jgi:hypothetical protein
MTIAGGIAPAEVPGPELLRPPGKSRSACVAATWLNTKMNTIVWTMAHIKILTRRDEFRPIMEDSYLRIVLSPLQYLTPPRERGLRTACPLPRHTLLPKFQLGALEVLSQRKRILGMIEVG